MSGHGRMSGGPRSRRFPAPGLGCGVFDGRFPGLRLLRLRPPSRFPSGIKAVGLPTTVAGAASDWGLEPVTVFPFDPLAGHRPGLDTGRSRAPSTGIEPRQSEAPPFILLSPDSGERPGEGDFFAHTNATALSGVCSPHLPIAAQWVPSSPATRERTYERCVNTTAQRRGRRV